MIVIDWISTPDHCNFNRAFFGAINHKVANFFVFSEKLVIPGVKCEFLAAPESRLRRALFVIRLISAHRDLNILLLTYDPLLLPLALLFGHQIIVFEHNTTPEQDSWLKELWQRVLFRKVCRLAQFRGQYERLDAMGQRVTYIGSPLNQIDMKSSFRNISNIYVAPSYRANAELIYKYANILAGSEVLVKELPDGKSNIEPFSGVKLSPVKRIDFQHPKGSFKAILITVDSRIRGSGWFNDAISNNVPIVILSEKTCLLFQETFPDYPFVDISNLSNSNELEKALKDFEGFNGSNYISKHNNMIEERFSRLILDFNDVKELN